MKRKWKLAKKKGADDFIFRLVQVFTPLLAALMPLFILIGTHHGWF